MKRSYTEYLNEISIVNLESVIAAHKRHMEMEQKDLELMNGILKERKDAVEEVPGKE